MSFGVNKFFFKAFTLAEVLIVLGIIGIIAEMTIPELVENVQDMNYRIAWKKAYSVLSQAAALSLQDNGGTFVGVVTSDDATLAPIFTTYIGLIKECSTGATNGQCFHANGGWQHADKTLADGTGDAHEAHDQHGLILKNGFMMKWCSWTCTNASPNCANVYVDINGFKPPNTVGKDIFGFNVMTNRLKPFGSQGTSLSGTCATSGYGCSADYLLNN